MGRGGDSAASVATTLDGEWVGRKMSPVMQSYPRYSGWFAGYFSGPSNLRVGRL
jgi:hypothetical protein